MSLINKLVLPHIIRPSRVSSKSAIIYLHGLAGAEHHARRLEEKFPEYGFAAQHLNIITPRGIFFHEKVKEKNTYKWFDVSFTTDPPSISEENFHESRVILSKFVSEVISEYNLDRQQTFMMGFSQGAIMSLAVALTQPQALGGVIALSGRIPSALRRIVDPSKDFSNLKVYLGHGKDDELLKINYAQTAQEFLKKLNLKSFTYEEYPNTKHEMNELMLSSVSKWLQSNEK